MKINSLLFFLSFLVAGISNSPLTAQETNGFSKEQLVQNGDTLNYQILYPKGFSKEKQFSVVLFLHGAGERGDDNEAQLTHGSSLFLENQEEFPAIVIFPQAPQRDYWAKVDVDREETPFEFNFQSQKEPTESLQLVMDLMDSIITEEFVNKDRVYVGGLSMGGMGTYELLYRKPEMFAAAFAICGGADPEIVKEYPKGFNIWIFHGEKDDVVLPKYSKIMAREINHHGGNAKLSLYPDDNHNSWDSAFAEPYLLPWLFSHKRNNE